MKLFISQQPWRPPDRTGLGGKPNTKGESQIPGDRIAFCCANWLRGGNHGEGKKLKRKSVGKAKANHLTWADTEAWLGVVSQMIAPVRLWHVARLSLPGISQGLQISGITSQCSRASVQFRFVTRENASIRVCARFPGAGRRTAPPQEHLPLRLLGYPTAPAVPRPRQDEATLFSTLTAEFQRS